MDGYVVRVVRADTYVHELAQQSLGDGFYGFSVSLDSRVMNGGSVVAARLANIGTVGGSRRSRSNSQSPLADPS